MVQQSISVYALVYLYKLTITEYQGLLWICNETNSFVKLQPAQAEISLGYDKDYIKFKASCVVTDGL
jgi:hypothetical protein